MTIASAPIAIGDNLAGTATSYTDAACTSPSDGTRSVERHRRRRLHAAGRNHHAGRPDHVLHRRQRHPHASAGATFQWRNFGTPLVGATAQH